MATSIENIKIIVSVDEDDSPEKYKKIHDCVTIVIGKPLGKIDAINRDMPNPSEFDIILLASDDMIPIKQGYDDIIRQKMQDTFSDGDGVLFFNDGYRGYYLNTLVICGSKYYSRFGYIYYPEYKSVFCDNEFMDVANQLGRQIYIDDVIIKHEHPVNTPKITIGIKKFFNKQKSDNLYKTNKGFWNRDLELYTNRQSTTFDLSVLICTIPARHTMFIEILNRLTLLKQSTTLSIEVLFDNTEKISIGEKRNRLLQRSKGTFCCFIDDNDKVTDDYFKIIEESELKYDCVLLNGKMFVDEKEYLPFCNSIEYTQYSQNSMGYDRIPNHLNPMKTNIAIQIGFPDKNVLEDIDFSERLLKSGLLKTEYKHDKLQYFYMFVKNKTESYSVTEPYFFPKMKGFKK
jgi:hypothetical protein